MNDSDESDESLYKNDMNVEFMDMYMSIYSMRMQLENERKPLGNRENPAKTCRDLYYSQSQYNDGKLKCEQ